MGYIKALALLQFKHMFIINPNASDYCRNIITDQDIQSYPRTLSWNKSTHCCSWDGVHCDKTTGKVIELDLRCSQLQGKFHSNSSLFQLSNLKRLDLSYNDFTGLRPHNFELLLKNLTQLRDLNLDYVDIFSIIPLNFSSYLTDIRLPYIELRGVLPERVLHLFDLESLDLSHNPQLTVRFPTTKWNSSASLMKIPESFCQLTSLLVLGMSYSNLLGPILWNLTNIEILYLDYNHLEGPISHFSRFEKLKELSLRNNNLDE
ncbi:hypothetical protein H5410_000281 [Solanum commersonii]|uniref:Leucine-rich repeat-containing N-terminal plant-type domain-containing protein n=1 Tax=Solanum commersonii TaxID=4109 RepID=A0A9J6AVU4_SOLCO|nr:hypothetical protein H5410_000281 [Solanum commersonii]